jgi:hypothetical protein
LVRLFCTPVLADTARNKPTYLFHALSRLTILLLSVSIALVSCCASHRNPAQDPALQALAERTLGKETIVDLNAAKTFALYQQKPGADHARRRYRYAVIRLEDNKIVQEGSFSMGYVKWLDDESIEVLSESRTTAAEGGTKKIFHVNSRSGKNPVP